MIRKQGLIGLLIFAVIVLLIFYLLSDSMLESQFEEIGTSVNGAKVDIDNLDFSLFSLKVGWDRLQITDPKHTMRNKLETAESRFDMEFLPLLSGKIIIEDFQIKGIRTNTEREEDGKIEKKKSGESKPGFIQNTIKSLENEVKQTPVMNLSDYSGKLNVDSIVAMVDLQTPARFDTLEEAFDEQYEKWTQQISGKEYEKRLSDLESRIKAVDTDNLNDLTKVQAVLTEVKEIQQSAKTLTDDINNVKSDFRSNLKGMKEKVGNVDDWIREDYERAISMAQLPDIDAGNIGKMIFGDRVVQQFNTYLGYAKTAREYSAKFKSDDTEDKNPPRLEGQDIYFYNQNARPDFWIKRINLDGVTESGIRLEGIIKNIVSDQRLIGAMTDFHFLGKDSLNTSLRFEGLFNYLEQSPVELFQLSYSNFPLKNIRFTDSPYLPEKIDGGNGTLETHLELNGSKVKGEMAFRAGSLRFPEEEERDLNQAEALIQELIRKTTNVRFNARVSGKEDDLKFSIGSNLDEKFSEQLRSLVGDKINQAREEIKTRIDEQVGAYTSKADQLIADYQEKIQKEVDDLEKNLEEKKQLIEQKRAEIEAEKKKIEEKLEKEKKKLEEDAKKKIKDLFNN